MEEKIYAEWTDKGCFTADAESDKPVFSIVIPPPNVTGSLHMGHALNNTLQDILARHRRLTGHNVLWLPGCDHAGIATQNVVERELKKEKISKHDLGREKFTEKVWEWKEKYGTTIMMQLRKLGSSLDWSRERFTMDEGLSKAVREVFVRLYEEGLIYRGDYIVNWCPRCHTAISDIEVAHKEINGNLYQIRYVFADNPGRDIQVATTRPETMLGDVAVAVHPDDERYKDVAEGTLLILPETGRAIPVIKDAYVDKEFGTGAVKITPAHDPNDFEIGLRHKLEIIKVMDESGKMNENAGIRGKYKGMDRFAARKKLVEELQTAGLMPQILPHKHAVGHCYRCDTVIEPYVSAQWFVRIKPIAGRAVEAVEKGEIKFTPDHWKKVYFEWMGNIKDWCISRQLWWGHRIPAFYCDKCGETTVSKEDVKECPKCGGSVRQDEDVLDTWFSSALWPFSTLGWPEKTKGLKAFYPTSVLVTGWDILFFWVARMIMMGLKFMGKVPFYEVAINSLVGDSEGKKMSKSKGNVIDPLDIMKKYSADALRFTMASLETQSRYIAFSEERVKGYSNFMNKIWNASKYVVSNTQGCDEALPGNDGLKMPEKWILNELNTVITKTDEAISKYRFSDYANLTYEFFWRVFCDWYIEMSKIELSKENNSYSGKVKSVLLYVLKKSLILLHPIVPFITEEIYKYLPVRGKRDFIMQEDWPKPEGRLDGAEGMEAVSALVYSIRNLRGEFGVSPAVRVKAFFRPKDGEAGDIINSHIEIVKNLAKADEVLPLEGLPSTAVGREVPAAGWAGIDIEGVVDVAKQREAAKKKLQNLENLIKTIEAKLATPGFAENAPKKAVEEEKMKIEKSRQDIAGVNEMLSMLEKAAK